MWKVRGRLGQKDARGRGRGMRERNIAYINAWNCQSNKKGVFKWTRLQWHHLRWWACHMHLKGPNCASLTLKSIDGNIALWCYGWQKQKGGGGGVCVCVSVWIVPSIGQLLMSPWLLTHSSIHETVKSLALTATIHNQNSRRGKPRATQNDSPMKGQEEALCTISLRSFREKRALQLFLVTKLATRNRKNDSREYSWSWKWVHC